MNIEHLKAPFCHTIINDVFSMEELWQIEKELSFLFTFKLKNQEDKHHSRLFKENNTISFSLDEVYSERRDASNVLKLVRRVYELYESGALYKEDNPYLGYIPCSNADNTYIQAYANGSSYYEHDDAAVLTCLFVLEGAEKFEGGKLHFTTHDYYPELTSNSCIIFPSYEMHELTPISTESNTVVRVSINHRIYITPKEI